MIEGIKNQVDNVENVEHEPKPKPERDNQLEIIYQDEPIE